MKQGRSLELLVERLERLLTDDPSVDIESPKFLPDKQTNQRREHDVVLTYNKSHHELLVAIECKDRSRPVGVPDIEAFSSKCKSTGVNKGIIVSSSGFTKTALSKSSAESIKCLELKEIETASFLLPEAVVVLHTKKFLTASYTPIFNQHALRVADDYDIFDPSGVLITDDIIKNNLRLIEDKLPHGKLNEEHTETVLLKMEGYYVVSKLKKLRHEITGILMDITYIHEVEESQFTSRLYNDASINSSIAEIATAPLKIDDVEREFTVIGKSDGTTYNFIS